MRDLSISVTGILITSAIMLTALMDQPTDTLMWQVAVHALTLSTSACFGLITLNVDDLKGKRYAFALIALSSIGIATGSIFFLMSISAGLLFTIVTIIEIIVLVVRHS